MTRPLVVALLLLLAANPCTPALEIDDPHTKVYVVSSYAFGGNTDKFPKTPAGLVDLRHYLEIRDIKLPASGSAAYDPSYATVTVRAPEHVLEQLDQLWKNELPWAVRVSFTLVEFNLGDSTALPLMDYEELKKAAGNSWRVVDRVTLMGKSGHKVTSEMQGREKSATKPKAPPKQKGAEEALWPNPLSSFGSRVEMEPMIGAGAAALEVSFVYLYHSRPVGEMPEAFMNVQTNVTLLHNVPVIVHTTTVNPPKGDQARAPAKELAVIAHAIVVDAAGRAFSLERIGPASPDPREGSFLSPTDPIGTLPPVPSPEPKPKR